MSELFHVSIFHILLSFLVFHRPPITPKRCAKSRLLSPQKAVIHIGCVDVGSRDRPCRVVGGGGGALAGACARAWGVKRRNGAVRSAHQAMIYVVGVSKVSGDRACRIDVDAAGAL